MKISTLIVGLVRGLLVMSTLVMAAEEDTTCGFWCKIGKFFGIGREEAVVGGAV